jgi:hypothetical protein
MAREIKKPAEAPSKEKRRERISELLKAIEDRLEDAAGKATLSDYIRLTQLERELEEEEPPREIKVTWIYRQEKSAIEK